VSHVFLDKRIPHSNIKYLTQEIIDNMPPLRGTVNVPLDDKIVQVKFFTPDSGWTWYIVEASAILKDGTEAKLSDVIPNMDIIDVRMFGYVDPGDYYGEWGYVLLSEIYTNRGPYPFHMPIERDKFFRPTPAKEVIQ